jgi:hypothetical protein
MLDKIRKLENQIIDCKLPSDSTQFREMMNLTSVLLNANEIKNTKVIRSDLRNRILKDEAEHIYNTMMNLALEGNNIIDSLGIALIPPKKYLLLLTDKQKVELKKEVARQNLIKKQNKINETWKIKKQ